MNAKNVELEELASIARDQIDALEKYNRHRNYEYDSLQRRLLELQSLSDEKVIIGTSPRIRIF